ncbi:nucleoside hydrolase [Dyadobacter sandarakinus]|uniref:Nucleoside hydrolase n=1 Tax=Dyadobacter sandarakinus TaxID=2747268 RepID=A0ABX7I3C4_9BACT|nr:nucleoside hydrolase [Dyadobacter sandarakinus]QRR00572.1 nucleoside hydrolase [Dyadobacter sandarakinus]
MKYASLALPLLSMILSCTGHKGEEVARPGKPAIILDTDIGPDYDDVGAVAMMHALADSGEVEPLAIIASNAQELVVPTIDVLNTYFGRPDLPTAAPKRPNAPQAGASQGWPELLTGRYPHRIRSSTEAPDALTAYRRLLAAQPDSSVTIVTIGFLTNMASLLDSRPDSISDLNGKELIGRKVKRLVSMAGAFPEGREYNVLVDSVASGKVFTQWPTEIIFSGFEIGKAVVTGLRLTQDTLRNSPVKDAFAKAMSFSKGDSLGRMSWDQTAVLAAARGAERYFGLQRGYFIPKGGNNAWKDDPKGPHAYLKFKTPVPELTRTIEDLMMHHPVTK